MHYEDKALPATLLLCGVLTACADIATKGDASTRADGAAICPGLGAALEHDGLHRIFNEVPWLYAYWCKRNPFGERLWATDEAARKERLTGDYCRISPVFRGCLICARLSLRKAGTADPDNTIAYETCEHLLTDADRAFAERIWGG